MAHSQLGPVFNADIITHILTFCSTSTLGTLARVDKDVYSATIPTLYRHLCLDLDTSSQLLSEMPRYVGQSQEGDIPLRCLDIGSDRFRHTRSLLIRAHHWGTCLSQHHPIVLPNLHSIHFQISRLTYHWPHGCQLVSAIQPPPKEMIVSATDDCDILYWMFGSRCYDKLPQGLEHLIIRLNRRSRLREWSLSGMMRDIKHSRGVEIVIEYMADEEDIALENVAILALTRPRRLILRERIGETMSKGIWKGDGAGTLLEGRRKHLLSLMLRFSKDQGLGEEDVAQAIACLEIQ